MTLNGVMAVILRYFTEFGKHAFQQITASSRGGIYARVYCICSTCTMSSYRKFTFAISSPDEFLVLVVHNTQTVVLLIISPVYDFSYLSEDGHIGWTVNHCQLIAWTLDVDDSVWPSGHLS